jgi:hypothetical protein
MSAAANAAFNQRNPCMVGVDSSGVASFLADK